MGCYISSSSSSPTILKPSCLTFGKKGRIFLLSLPFANLSSFSLPFPLFFGLSLSLSLSHKEGLISLLLFLVRSLKMAISSYPTPADAGVLCIILANTAISISIMKEIVRSILHVVGIRIASWEELSADPSGSGECRKGLSESYMEEFRSQIPAMRFDSLYMHDCLAQECSICLSEFEPNTEVNRLTCGHVFHNLCLEKWLNYWNTTCPLCRNCMMPQEMEEEDTCPIMEYKKRKKPYGLFDHVMQVDKLRVRSSYVYVQ